MLDSESEQLGQNFVAFIQAFGLLRTDATPCGQPMSVSTAHAICELATHGPLNQKELADRLGLDTSTVSRLVDQLAKKGWAERGHDHRIDDSRVRLVGLTVTGRHVAGQVLDARVDRFARLLDAVDESKRVQVLEALNLLKEAANAIS